MATCHQICFYKFAARTSTPLNWVLAVMDPAGIYEVQVALMESLSGLWEIWLAGTFAVITGFHLGNKSISLRLLVVAVVLYLLVTTTIFLRYFAYASAIGGLDAMLIAAGQEEFPLPSGFGRTNFLITFVTFFIGSVATVSFAVIQYRKGGDS